MGKFQYTPMFSYDSSLITVWGAILEKIRHRPVDRKYLQRMLRFVKWPFVSLHNLPTEELALRRQAESYALLKDEKAHDVHCRQT